MPSALTAEQCRAGIAAATALLERATKAGARRVYKRRISHFEAELARLEQTSIRPL
jgi:hypothetical protein